MTPSTTPANTLTLTHSDHRLISPTQRVASLANTAEEIEEKQLVNQNHRFSDFSFPNGVSLSLESLTDALHWRAPLTKSLNADMSQLAAWESFYEIVGSAAGALIGLQFVVMTLVAARPPLRVAEAGPAFATPTIIHFSTALLLSALLRIPWQSIVPAAASWGLVGVCGAAYALVVTRRIWRQNAYQPEFEDWLFHAMLPLLAYAILVLSALEAPSRTREALFGVGAAALMLLFIGIHNAWDSTSYHVFSGRYTNE
jgi:hypothetical protein